MSFQGRNVPEPENCASNETLQMVKVPTQYRKVHIEVELYFSFWLVVLFAERWVKMVPSNQNRSKFQFLIIVVETFGYSCIEMSFQYDK